MNNLINCIERYKDKEFAIGLTVSSIQKISAYLPTDTILGTAAVYNNVIGHHS